ncbi:MAG TPA: adenylate/guanylate cyclase domain-containing protein [Acidimicrobiales bacterium]
MSDAEPESAVPPARVRLPLKAKLSLVITVLVVSTIALVAAVLLHQEQRTLTEEMTKRGLTIATGLAASAKSALPARDEPALNLLVKDVMRDPDVTYVIVVDHEERIVAHHDLSLIGRRLERPAGLAPLRDTILVQSYADPQRGQLIDFGVPLVFSQIPVGAVYLGFSRKPIEQALARARNQALLASAVMVGIGLVGAVGLATLLSRPIHRLVDGTRAIAAGDYGVSLAVPSGDELGVLTESFNRMAKSLRDKHMIERAFSSYVAREVADAILRDPEHLVLAGERCDVSVLFCDLRGFTSLAERLPPEQVVLLLNQFYTLAVDSTFKHGGTLDKFLGDGVMAIFGAPIRHPDHATQAVRAAVAMRAAAEELSDKRQREGKLPITVGIGVSAGEAVAGTMGTEDRMEYTVVGDSVNLAARLEAEAQPGQILVSGATFERVREVVWARSLGLIKLKGKEEPVEAYEVLGLAPSA